MMINEMILSSQLALCSLLSPISVYNETSCIEEYEYEDVIKTDKPSIKDSTGSYPWESVKIINGETYYLYKSYFRTEKVRSKTGRYIQKLYTETGRCKYYLQNINDNSEILYYSIEDIMDIINSRIEMYEQSPDYKGKKEKDLIFWINYLRIMELLSK